MIINQKCSEYYSWIIDHVNVCVSCLLLLILQLCVYSLSVCFPSNQTITRHLSALNLTHLQHRAVCRMMHQHVCFFVCWTRRNTVKFTDLPLWTPLHVNVPLSVRWRQSLPPLHFTLAAESVLYCLLMWIHLWPLISVWAAELRAVWEQRSPSHVHRGECTADIYIIQRHEWYTSDTTVNM